jgi:DNA-binding MarR family transcriptional regulator
VVANRRRRSAKRQPRGKDLLRDAVQAIVGADTCIYIDMTTMTSTARASARSRSATTTSATLDRYAQRGRDCAYGNVRMIARSVGSLYDETLRPVDLRAGQLALLWAILATEPVEMVRLGAMTLTDPTTLSRTVANLRRTGLVNVRRGEDGRTKMLSLSAHGRERFAAAMPYWEEAQRRVARLLPVLDMRALARRVHKAAQQS